MSETLDLELLESVCNESVEPFTSGMRLRTCGTSRFLVCSNIFLLNDNLDKREWTYVFGACCLVTIFIPSFRYYRLYSFFGVVAITYTSWYMTVSALIYGQVIQFNPADQLNPHFHVLCAPLWSFPLLFNVRNVIFYFFLNSLGLGPSTYPEASYDFCLARLLRCAFSLWYTHSLGCRW